MRLIRDFTQCDTPTLFQMLRGFWGPLIGYPIMFAIVPMVLLVVAARSERLWWFIAIYTGGILVLTCLIGTAYGRLVTELRKRMEAMVENRPSEGTR